MDSMREFDERKMKENVMTQSIPSMAQSLQELSNNLARSNILECLRGIHEVGGISDKDYEHELRSLLKRYNFEIDADKQRRTTGGML